MVTRHKDIAELCKSYGVEAVLHDLPHRSDTVRLGLEKMDGMQSCMFCPADQPLLSRDLVASLALAAANCREYIWRVSFEGIQGSPVLFPRWAFDELMELPEGKGGGEVIKKYPRRVRTVEAGSEYELRDADTPDDMAELSHLLMG